MNPNDEEGEANHEDEADDSEGDGDSQDGLVAALGEPSVSGHALEELGDGIDGIVGRTGDGSDDLELIG